MESVSMKLSHIDPRTRGGRRRIAPFVLLVFAAVGCSKEEPATEGPFKSFEPAANDPAAFTEPRDAVPLDNGAIAFLARAPGSNTPDQENAGEEGATAQLVDRYAVFVKDDPKAALRILTKDLVAPLNIASNGRDLLFVADIGGGATGGGAIVQLPVAGGAGTPLAEGFRPRGVATDAGGKVFFTGTDPATGQPGVFALEGNAGRAIVTGGQLKSPSGLDIADDGTIYVADSSAARDLDDGQVTGSGHGVVFKIVGGTATVVTAGFEAGYPTGLALTPSGKLAISAYAGRGSQSAVILVDPANPAAQALFTEKLTETFASAGLHRSRATGQMAWSGGDTVYIIQP
jgi:hypothetical protein